MARRVLIVDDHDDFRNRLRQLLEADGYEIVGEAPDGASTKEAAVGVQPDLILLDVHLPDALGFDLVGDLSPPVILISTHDEEAYRDRALACGARGFITKGALSGAAIEDLLN